MKRLAGLILILIVFFSMTTADAETNILSEEIHLKTGSTNAGISNTAALEGFINRAFGIGASHLTGRTALLRGTGDRLTGVNAQAYSQLADYAHQVAEGEITSTQFALAFELFYTADDLEVENLSDSDGNITAEAEAALQPFITLDLNKVLNSLLVDFPYDLYWFDKKAGISFSGYAGETSISDNAIVYTQTGITVEMYVAEEYRVGGSNTKYNTGYAETIHTAVQNAREIVTANEGKPDYQKLKAYKDAICNMVDYNYDAAENNTTYGNPWQLIWVFDDDDSTKVVCEGYSKAFKYLCDMSSFADVTTIIVSGTMQVGNKGGAHMWNLVETGGAHYLVDVTNCDNNADGSFSVGYPYELFMVGYDSRYEIDDNKTWYIYTANDEYVYYIYDDDIYQLYSAEELAVSDSDYEVQPFICALPQEVGMGEDITLTAGVPNKNVIHIGLLTGNNVVEDVGGGMGDEYILHYTLDEAGEYEFCVGYTDENENTVLWMTDVSVQVTVNVLPIVHSLCGMERRFFIGMDYNPEQAEYGKVISDSYIDILYVENSAACQETYTGEPIWTILENGEVPTYVDLRTDASGRMELYLKAMPTQAQDVEYEIQCEWAGKVGTGIYTIHFVEADNGLPTAVQFNPANHLASVKAGSEFEYNISFADWNGPQDGEYFRDLSENLNDVMGDDLIPEVPGIYEGYMETGCENILWREPLTVIVTNADGTMSASLYTPRGIVEYLPADLQQIEEKAFENVLMTEVDIPEGVNFIAGDAFDGCGLVAMYVHHNQIAVDFALDHGIIALTD